MSSSRLQHELRAHWPHPRPAGSHTLYNFGSEFVLAVIVWHGRGLGYTCEIERWDDNDEAKGKPCPPDVEALIDAWGAATLEGACLSLEHSMRQVLLAEGKDPESFC